MNKKNTGLILKQLRKNKGYSQNDIITILDKNYFSVSQKTVSDWENGKSIPNIEILTILADLYGVTITELLDGSINTNCIADEKGNLSNNGNSIEKNCIKLLKSIKFVNNFINKFLTDNYLINDLLTFKSIINEHYLILNMDIAKKFDQNFYLFMRTMEDVSNNKTLSFKEKYYSIHRLLILKNEIINEVIFNDDPTIISKEIFLMLFNVLEFYEKDMLLMKTLTFQNKVNNYEYKINMMIENGALFNKAFLPKTISSKCECKIVDLLDKIFEEFIKPLEVNVIIPNKGIQHYLIENTHKNYFYLNYASLFINNFSCKFSEFYELCKNSYELCDELVLNAAHKKNIDTDRDIEVLRDEVMKSIDIDPSTPHFLYESRKEQDYIKILKFNVVYRFI